jgi:hypothetical protein
MKTGIRLTLRQGPEIGAVLVFSSCGVTSSEVSF